MLLDGVAAAPTTSTTKAAPSLSVSRRRVSNHFSLTCTFRHCQSKRVDDDCPCPAEVLLTDRLAMASSVRRLDYEVSTSTGRAPQPPQPTGHCSTIGRDTENQFSTAFTSEHMSSGSSLRNLNPNRTSPVRRRASSPLKNVDTNKSSPVRCRPILRSATNSVGSRASSVPTNVLDDIPEEKWSRVMPTASTPETSTPELSIDEITSTKLSLDEQAILGHPPKEHNCKETMSHGGRRTAFGHMWEDNSGRLKKMTKKLKKLPSGFFTRKEHRLHETFTSTTAQPIPAQEPSLPQLDLTTELCIPSTSTPPDSAPSANNKPLMLVCVPILPFVSAC